jgi:TRAP-type C4-dicarboxylate transport system substrate-binding protein
MDNRIKIKSRGDFICRDVVAQKLKSLFYPRVLQSGLKMINRKSIQLAVVLCMSIGLIVQSAWAKGQVIKLAVVMPEGSTWTNTIHDFANAVKAQTDGQVKFKIYAGGISGDESDVLRKMQANRIQAAGFSGVGLGMILPEIRILEAPLLFNNDAELDFVKAQLFNDFAARFASKGYVLLGFAEAGFVYVFAANDINADDSLKHLKMWVWKGDRVVEEFLKAFGMTTYPLHIADVNTGLETGMIDAFYAPPLAAVAFQWYSRARYMLDFPWANSTGALLMNKRVFDRLSPGNQTTLRRLAKTYAARLVDLTRKDNQEALGVLKDAGIEFVSPTSDQTASFQKSAKDYYQNHLLQIYPEALGNKVRQLLKDFRSK